MKDEGLYRCLEVPLQSCVTGGATQLSDGLEIHKCHMEKGQVQAAPRAFPLQVYPSCQLSFQELFVFLGSHLERALLWDSVHHTEGN